MQQPLPDRDSRLPDRDSRLPIFRQVRSMLTNRPSPSPPSLPPPQPDRHRLPRWDEYTGERSDTGRPSRVQPSTYVNPHDRAFLSARQPPSPARHRKARRSLSPVSVLPSDDDRYDGDGAPPSPVSPLDDDDDSFHRRYDSPDLVPDPLVPASRPRERLLPAAPIHATPVPKQIKRKPAPRSASAAEKTPPPPPPPAGRSPSLPLDAGKPDDDDPTSRFSWTTYATSVHPGHHSVDPGIGSHFSWSTYAPSVARSPPSVARSPPSAARPSRPSIDAMADRSKEMSPRHTQPRSRFSWSTINTAATPGRPESPPSSPPPPIPATYDDPPVRSILSRRRPIQRMEREEWTPPPSRERRTVAPSLDTAVTPTPANDDDNNTDDNKKKKNKNKNNLTTPTTTKRAIISSDSSPPTTSNTTKALPPPPSLASPSHPLTHIEALQSRERDLTLQRRNMETGIANLSRIEHASPMHVDWKTVRDARDRLDGYRARLDEVRLEEREVGIAISRARRKEGEEEGLWVRRVMG